MRPLFRLLAVTIAALAGAPALAQAACPDRLTIGFGDSPASIARACGISVETLRQANPGMTANTALQAGTTVTVPRPALPSQTLRTGRSSIEVMPSIVPPATGTASPTVIKPPKPHPVPRQHILKGLGDDRPNAGLFEMFKLQQN